jgi:hypothetical protein
VLTLLTFQNAAGMFKGTSMTVDNMDNTLRGWAKLDTAARAHCKTYKT